MLLTEGLSGFMLFGRMYWGSGFPCRYLQTYLLFSMLQAMKECVYLTVLPSFWLPFLVELCTPSWNVVLIDCKIHPHSNFKWQSERNGAWGAAGSLFIAIDRWTSNLVNSRSRSTFFVILCSAILQQILFLTQVFAHKSQEFGFSPPGCYCQDVFSICVPQPGYQHQYQPVTSWGHSFCPA